MSSNYCKPPVIQHGSFSPSRKNGSQLSCHPSFKPSQQGKLTCAWFFGPQGVVDISPLYDEHHHVIILRSYSTLACVPLGQGQAIPHLSTNSSSISGQEGGLSVEGDGNREMRFFDHMERRARLHMDEEESRHVELPVID